VFHLNISILATAIQPSVAADEGAGSDGDDYKLEMKVLGQGCRSSTVQPTEPSIPA
jgi:hypothetical protein